MLNTSRDSQSHENSNAEQYTTAGHHHKIPRITVTDAENYREHPEDNSGSATETEMSSSHRSGGSGSSKKNSKSKSKKDDWSDITDPEERRRVQNRIAQRKFRDKAKETKERQERDAENRAHAHHSYHTPDPREMTYEDDLSGVPWGSFSLQHVFSKGRSRESDSRRGSHSASHSQPTSQDNRSPYEAPEQVFEDQDGYYEDAALYDDGDRGYYDYGSGSGSVSGGGGGSHGGSSR